MHIMLMHSVIAKLTLCMLAGHNAGSTVHVWCYPGDPCADRSTVHSREPSHSCQVTVGAAHTTAVVAV